jgi:hypothetical protein
MVFRRCVTVNSILITVVWGFKGHQTATVRSVRNALQENATDGVSKPNATAVSSKGETRNDHADKMVNKLMRRTVQDDKQLVNSALEMAARSRVD